MDLTCAYPWRCCGLSADPDRGSQRWRGSPPDSQRSRCSSTGATDCRPVESGCFLPFWQRPGGCKTLQDSCGCQNVAQEDSLWPNIDNDTWIDEPRGVVKGVVGRVVRRVDPSICFSLCEEKWEELSPISFGSKSCVHEQTGQYDTVGTLEGVC